MEPLYISLFKVIHTIADTVGKNGYYAYYETSWGQGLGFVSGCISTLRTMPDTKLALSLHLNEWILWSLASQRELFIPWCAIFSVGDDFCFEVPNGEPH